MTVYLTYLRYTPVAKNFLFYFGVGPGFSSSRSQSKKELLQFKKDTLDLRLIEEGKGRQYRFLARMIVGCEWFITSRLSFLAESGFRLMYTIAKTESFQNQQNPRRPWDTRNENERTNFNLRGLGGRVGISIYF